MDTKTLIRQARQAVAASSCNSKKLTAIHAGVAAAAGLIVALLSYLLDSGMGGTGGLSGIGTRALLETVQSVLSLAVNILSPFWGLGFVAVTLALARQQHFSNHTLTAGFRICWPVLRLVVLEGLLCAAVVIVTMQVGTYLYLISPLSNAAAALLEQIAALNPTDSTALLDLMATLDPQVIKAIAWSAMPFVVIPVLIVLIPLSYRLRLAQYLLLDHPQMGAMAAIMLSFRLMKKNCLKLFALDLRLCWFYLLEVLVLALSYGDLLLPLVGIGPNSSSVMLTFLFYALALVFQVGLYVWQKPQVMTAYALFYDGLLPREEVQAEA